jgi:hypothetical protein
MLSRLEVCNFFRSTKKRFKRLYAVVLVSEVSNDFIRIFLVEYFAEVGVKAEIKENLTN